MTHEPELVDPVDLCTPDGSLLNPAARGWSRRTLHRANLHGCEGRNKRWDYWAVLAGDLIVSAVYSDVDYIGLADVYWANIPTGETGGAGIAVPGAEGIEPDGPAPLPRRDDFESRTTPRDRRALAEGCPAVSTRWSLAATSPQRRHPWSDEFNFTSSIAAWHGS
jgi:hypothetical protein